MTQDFQTMFTSPIFCISVGPEKIPFHIHSDILTQLSPVLAKYVEGSFSESTEKCAVLDDIDPGTFAEVINFIYSGDYAEPSPCLREQKDDPPKSREAKTNPSGPLGRRYCIQDFWKAFSAPPLTKWDLRFNEVDLIGWHEPKDLMPKVMAKESAEDGTSFSLRWGYACSLKRGLMSEKPMRLTWQPYIEARDIEDYSTVLLCHAKLYVFANRYSMISLGNLALQRLGATLDGLRLDDAMSLEIVELIRYSYGNTLDRREGIDKLRSLILSYIMCWQGLLGKNKNFMALLEVEGQIGRNVYKFTVLRDF